MNTSTTFLTARSIRITYLYRPQYRDVHVDWAGGRQIRVISTILTEEAARAAILADAASRAPSDQAVKFGHGWTAS